MTETYRMGGSDYPCLPPKTCPDCLARSALASELTEHEAQRLYDIATIKALAKGDVLISQNEIDNHLYVVSRGELDVVRDDGTQQEIQLARIGPGTVTGELAFLDGLKRTATVRAATDECCVIGLESEKLEKILNTDSRLVYKVMRAILRAAHHTVGKMDKTYSDVIRYIQQ
jgi:CRP/FNR family transcriptional regulator, cyclic AMP receptor protein